MQALPAMRINTQLKRLKYHKKEKYYTRETRALNISVDISKYQSDVQ